MQKAFEQSILRIEYASYAEQDLLMEMVGASLDKLCVDDEVRYIDKYWRTKTAELENAPMIVVSTDGLAQPAKNANNSRTITLYNKVYS